MRKAGLATLAAMLMAGSAMAGDVGVIKGPGWWGPIYFDYVRNPTGIDGVYTLGGVAEGSVRGETGPGTPAEVAVAATAVDAGQAAHLAAVIPAGADRATLLKLRQALADEAARRGLR